MSETPKQKMPLIEQQLRALGYEVLELIGSSGWGEAYLNLLEGIAKKKYKSFAIVHTSILLKGFEFKPIYSNEWAVFTKSYDGKSNNIHYCTIDLDNGEYYYVQNPHDSEMDQPHVGDFSELNLKELIDGGHILTYVDSLEDRGNIMSKLSVVWANFHSKKTKSALIIPPELLGLKQEGLFFLEMTNH